MIPQQVLTTQPPLKLSVVIDEAVLLWEVGSREVMDGQLRHLVETAELPNVELWVLPLQSETPLRADSFMAFGFSSRDESGKLGDVVSTEGVSDELRIEGETDTHMFRLIFDALFAASLPPDDTRELILKTAQRLWTEHAQILE